MLPQSIFTAWILMFVMIFGFQTILWSFFRHQVKHLSIVDSDTQSGIKLSTPKRLLLISILHPTVFFLSFAYLSWILW